MIKYVVTDEHNRYTRISKAEARRRFNRGESVYVIAHKMRPGMPFSLGMTVHGQAHLDDWRASYGDKPHPTVPELTPWDRMLNDFLFYNAGCHETGHYAAFYDVTDRN